MIEILEQKERNVEQMLHNIYLLQKRRESIDWDTMWQIELLLEDYKMMLSKEICKQAGESGS